MVIFFFILKMVYCVYSLESPRWGDSDENTQHTFILKKIEKISILSLLTWRYDQPSLARTTPVSNWFSWSHRCSSHRSSTVFNSTVVVCSMTERSTALGATPTSLIWHYYSGLWMCPCVPFNHAVYKVLTVFWTFQRFYYSQLLME